MNPGNNNKIADKGQYQVEHNSSQSGNPFFGPLTLEQVKNLDQDVHQTWENTLTQKPGTLIGGRSEFRFVQSEEQLKAKFSSVLEEAKRAEPVQEVIEINEFVEAKEVISEISNISVVEPKANEPIAAKEVEIKPTLAEGLKKGVMETIPYIQIGFKKAIPGVTSILGIWFEMLVSDDVTGVKSKKVESNKSPEDQKKADEAKKLKQAANQKSFIQQLLQGAFRINPFIRGEMSQTNQVLGFHDQYEGIIDRKSGDISLYHRVFRIKKEAEMKAQQIASERANKMVQGKGKAPQGQRAGELLMGAENPSHYTKALG